MIADLSSSPVLFQCGRWGVEWWLRVWPLASNCHHSTLPLPLSFPICKMGVKIEREGIYADHATQ